MRKEAQSICQRLVGVDGTSENTIVQGRKEVDRSAMKTSKILSWRPLLRQAVSQPNRPIRWKIQNFDMEVQNYLQWSRK